MLVPVIAMMDVSTIPSKRAMQAVKAFKPKGFSAMIKKFELKLMGAVLPNSTS